MDKSLAKRPFLIGVLITCLSLSPAQSQILAGILNPAPTSGGGGTWALVQSIGGQSGDAGSLSCTGAVCTLTVASTGSAHGLLLFTNGFAGSGVTISSVTGGCSSWAVDSGAHVSSGAISDVNGAYCLSSSSGSTSIVVTFSSSSPGTVIMTFFEQSWSGSSITHDTSGEATRTAGTTVAGVTLTISTTDAVGQFVGLAGGSVSSVTTPYNTNLVTTDTIAEATLSLSGGSVAYTSSGTAPTWTPSASESALVSAMALKGN